MVRTPQRKGVGASPSKKNYFFSLRGPRTHSYKKVTDQFPLKGRRIADIAGCNIIFNNSKIKRKHKSLHPNKCDLTDLIKHAD